MKRKSGTDGGTASTPSSTPEAVAAAVAATAAYAGLLLVGFVAIWGALSVLELLPRDSPLTAVGVDARHEVARGLLLFGGFTLWTWACDRLLRRQWRRSELLEVRLSGRPLASLVAATVGIVAVGVGVWFSGAQSATPVPPFDGVLWLSLSFFLLVAAALEEIALRGVLLALWTGVLGPTAALGLTSLLFAWLHQSNPGASLLGLLNTLLAGWVLGAMALRSRSLAPPIALHFTWNWAQGLLFGLPVSGQRAGTSLLTLEPGRGPLAGGDYGFEGGLAATLVLSLGLLWALLPRKAAEMSRSEDS